MAIIDPMVLPADVVLLLVEDLPAETREQLEYKQGDYALTRPRSRTPSSIVDARTAGLLESFRQPATIVDAVIRYSRAEQLDPRETLELAFPVLQHFLNAGLLLAADSELARPIESSYARGDSVSTFRIVEPVHVILDTEVYLARAADQSFAALKIARRGAERQMEVRFGNEAAFLQRLDGRVNPRLFASGTADERPFLATSWCRGVDAYHAAALARARGPGGRPELVAIMERIAEAYAHLHEQGVLQGDVHPRNVLIDADGKVTLIDFGFARPIVAQGGAATTSGRAGVDLFMEPELAAARRAGLPSPLASPAGEQYSVAAVLYLLVTGAYTHDFVLETGEMLRQVREVSPLAFHDHGVSDFPRVERALRRALAKDPEDRFPTMDELCRDLRAASAADQEAQESRRGAPRRRRPAQLLLDEVLERLAIAGPTVSSSFAAPTASLYYGAAGFAYTLLRIACHRDDERLLALADVWSNRAVRDVASLPDDAFWNRELEITPEVCGKASLLYTAPGVHCVDALIARARGDDASQRHALAAFLAANARPWSHLDVAFGCAGNLLACALLLEALPPEPILEGAGLRSLGDDLCAEIWQELAPPTQLRVASQLRSLGAAHGWVGALYAVLRWCESSGAPIPQGFGERLDELAALATPLGRGLRWPSTVDGQQGSDGLRASWCNGAAGFVYLWTLAHRLFDEPSYGRVAASAAWTVFEAPQANGDLCCGLAGRAYALLNLYKHDGGEAWLDRARELADRATGSIRAHSLRRDSLYKGEIGVALLAADLEGPGEPCMPLFESEETLSGLR